MMPLKSFSVLLLPGGGVPEGGGGRKKKILMQTIMNKSDVTGNRKELRNHSTSAEATLWKMLKGKQIAGLKVRQMTFMPLLALARKLSRKV